MKVHYIYRLRALHMYVVLYTIRITCVLAKLCKHSHTKASVKYLQSNFKENDLLQRLSDDFDKYANLTTHEIWNISTGVRDGDKK